jgi:hypothetical protein
LRAPGRADSVNDPMAARRPSTMRAARFFKPKGRMMIRKLFPALIVVLATAALLAGCGGSGSSGSSSSTASTSASTAASTTKTTVPLKIPRAPANVADCKKGVKRLLPKLSATAKRKLEEVCEKSTSGDVQAKRAAAREACEAIVRSSKLPEGSAKQQALAGCKNAGKGK